MKKTILAIILMISVGFSITACGDALELVQTIDEMKKNNTLDTTNESDIDADISLDLEDAINNAMEANGETLIDNEGELLFDVPANFTYDDASGSYYSPDHSAQIMYVAQINDGSFVFVSGEIAEETLRENVVEAFGNANGFSMLDWEFLTIGEFDAFYFCAEYMQDDIRVIRHQILVNGTKKLHSIIYNYADVSEYGNEWTSICNSLKFE